MASVNFKSIFVAVVTLGLVAGVILEYLSSSRLRSELAALQSQMDDLKARSALEIQAATSQVNADELVRLRGEHSELLRLRGELSRLRSVQAETVKLQTELTRLRAVQANKPGSPEPQPVVDQEMEAYKAIGIAKMKYSRAWGIAFVSFAQANGGSLPETFEHAASFYPKDLEADAAGLAPDLFEIVYRGSLKEISKPASTIILRERMPFPNLRKPGTSRTYLFADGHSEIKATPDGNFDEWERERMVPAIQP